MFQSYILHALNILRIQIFDWIIKTIIVGTSLFVQSFSKPFDILKINENKCTSFRRENILEVTSIFLFIIINIQVTIYDGVTTSINVSIKYFKV